MMTPEQMGLFIRVARTGMACGLCTPQEWLRDYRRHAGQIHGYTHASMHVKEAEAAFAAFYRGCAASPEEDRKFAELDDAQMCQLFDGYIL